MFTHIFGGISAVEPIVSVLDAIMRGFAIEVQVIAWDWNEQPDFYVEERIWKPC